MLLNNFKIYSGSRILQIQNKSKLLQDKLNILLLHKLQRLELGISLQRNDHNYCIWERTQWKNGDTALINAQIRRL